MARRPSVAARSMTLLDNGFDQEFGRARRGSLGAFPPAKPQPKEEQALIEARTALLYNQPFFAHILLDRMSIYYTHAVPIAATDSRTIFINPTEFAKLSVPERVFVLAHEVGHAIFEHCQLGYMYRLRGYVPLPDGTKAPYSAEPLNICEDLVINAMLIEAKVGAFNRKWLHDPTVTGSMSVIDVYAKIQWPESPQPPPTPEDDEGEAPTSPGDQPPPPDNDNEEQKDNSGGKRPGVPAPGNLPGNGGSRFDQHLDPGTSENKDPGQAIQEREAERQEWTTTIQQAAASARAQGKMPGNLDRMISDIIEPPIDWREHMRGSLARSLGGGGFDFSSGDRRWITRDRVQRI